MMTNIVDCDLDKIKIGQAVRLVFKPSEGGPPVPMFTPAELASPCTASLVPQAGQRESNSMEYDRMDTLERSFGETAHINPEEWAVRVDLAACYRLLAHFGVG